MLMEKIYNGEFDLELIRVSPPKVDEAKAGMIVKRYRDLLKDYPPGKLEADGALPVDLLRKMGSSGFFGLSIETEYGGQGLNLHEYYRVVDEMVQLDISVAFTFLAHLSIGIKAIQLFGTEEQRRKYLTPAASGVRYLRLCSSVPKS